MDFTVPFLIIVVFVSLFLLLKIADFDIKKAFHKKDKIKEENKEEVKPTLVPQKSFIRRKTNNNIQKEVHKEIVNKPSEGAVVTPVFSDIKVDNSLYSAIEKVDKESKDNVDEILKDVEIKDIRVKDIADDDIKRKQFLDEDIDDFFANPFAPKSTSKSSSLFQNVNKKDNIIENTTPVFKDVLNKKDLDNLDKKQDVKSNLGVENNILKDPFFDMPAFPKPNNKSPFDNPSPFISKFNSNKSSSIFGNTNKKQTIPDSLFDDDFDDDLDDLFFENNKKDKLVLNDDINFEKKVIGEKMSNTKSKKKDKYWI